MRYDKRALRRLMDQRGCDEKTLTARTRLGPRTIYYLVRGVTKPGADTLGKLAHALTVDVDAFYTRKSA